MAMLRPGKTQGTHTGTIHYDKPLASDVKLMVCTNRCKDFRLSLIMAIASIHNAPFL